jgi:tRNA 2-selenouridine synthase
LLSPPPSEFITAENFLELIHDDRLLIDVRSEIEFTEGHIPGSINLPILSTEERALVGTTYKQQGPEAAIRLGHQIVSGEIKEQRIQAWIQKFQSQTKPGVLTCFRGGMRSQLAQAWCREAQVFVPRVQGGTKSLRNFLLQQLNSRSQQEKMTVISGATGVGKSLLLRELAAQSAVLDLEHEAHHRGSAFGGFEQAQPSQITFENRLSYRWLKLAQKIKEQGTLIVEDESRLIGRCVLPEAFFSRMRSSEVIFIEESLEVRTQITFDEYILATDLSKPDERKAALVFDHYQACVQRISRKLGGLRTSEILKDLATARQTFQASRDLEPNKVWIRKLLEWYYDPLYFKSLQQRKQTFIFRGPKKDVAEFLMQRRQS